MLSPLAERIYHILVRQLDLPDPLISYGDLVRKVGALPPPYDGLQRNDPRLFDALGEIARACQNSCPRLPILTSIVVRRKADGSLDTPGGGYFALVFPRVWEEAERLKKWEEELERVLAFPYPEELIPLENSRPVEPRLASGWLREPTVIAAIIGLIGTLLTVVISVLLSTRRDEPPQKRQPDNPVVNIILKGDEPSRPRQVDPPEEKKTPRKLSLDEVLDVLERYHQRATFGAVAEILGLEPISLFKGYTRTPRTAWVVSKSTGLPTGTKEDGYPPGLLQNKHVINTSEELRAWLLDHH